MIKRKKSKNTKHQSKKHQWSPWHYLIFVGIIMVLFFFLRGNYGFVRYWKLQKQKKVLLQQIVDLKKQQHELEIEINKLSNNHGYIEKIVREKYKMGKDGEKIYFMVPPPEKTTK